MVNCVCKQTLSECLKQFFHCGARGYSKAYAQRTLAIFEPYKLPFAGSNPAVRCKTYRQWFGFVLRDAKTVHKRSLSCARTF